MKKILLPICLIMIITAVNAQSIKTERIVDWSFAGLRQKYTPKKKVNVKHFGVKGDGLSDDTKAVTALITSIKATGGELYFPAGTYFFSGRLNLPSGTVINGAGADKTHFIFDSGSKELNCISISAGKPTAHISLAKVPTKGDLTLELKDMPEFKAGDYAEIIQDNGSWDKKPRDWAKNSVGQIVRVSKVEGKTVTIDHPIRITYDKPLNPRIAKLNPKQNIGIQNISIERLNQPSKGLNLNIQIRYAVNCWVKGVEGKKSVGSHLIITGSSNIEVSGCYFHHAFDYSGSGTKGYGVTLVHHTGECLIENNIFQHLRHAMMVKQGANGNVFAYNYSFEPNRKELISNYSGDISMHGHFPYANLFEGNVVQNIMADKYWGEAGPDNTLFRNRVQLYGIIYSPNGGNKHNIVANELTSRALFMGNLLLPGQGHLNKGNAVGKKASEEVLEKSLYYKNKPYFWNISDTFPSIGMTNSFNKGSIPALHRAKNETVWTVFFQ